MSKAIQFGARIGNIRLEATVRAVRLDIDVEAGENIYGFQPATRDGVPDWFYIRAKFYSPEDNALCFLRDDIRMQLRG